MTAAVLWLAADLAPWILAGAVGAAGLIALSIERVHRMRAEQRAALADSLAAALEKHIAALTELADARAERIEALTRWVDAIERQHAAEADVHALARHHAAAANEGLLPPERWN